MEKNALRHVQRQDDRPLEASIWLELPVLLGSEEMDSLISSLGSVCLFPISRPFVETPTPQDFLKDYDTYVNALLKGETPKPLQAYLLTNSIETLYGVQLEGEKTLVRAYLPSLFLKPHSFIFSPLDLKFRSKVYGPESITWGYSFCYPQFCVDPTTHQPEKVDEKYTNTPLFKEIQKWVRENTIPTPFIFGEKRINAPIRLGKSCLPLIEHHAQLKDQNLHVKH